MNCMFSYLTYHYLFHIFIRTGRKVLKNIINHKIILPDSKVDAVIKDYHQRYAHMKRDKLYKTVCFLLIRL